jgi:hypothetical protein
VLDLVSASQVTLFHDECARKWAWKYIARIESKPNASAALGTEVDNEQLQPFLREGRPIDYTRPSGEIAASALAFLPRPKSEGLEVQKHFVIPSPTWIDGKHCGLGFQGYLDLWLPKGGIPLPDGVSPEVDGKPVPVVGDFKTTGDFKWMKSATALATDTQAQLYALWAMYATRSPVVDLVWIYMRTKGARQARRTHLRVHAPHVAKQFSLINERALEVQEARLTVTDPKSLPPNPDQCEAFGGCPYRDKCNLGPGEIADAAAAKAKRKREATMTEAKSTMGLLAKLKAQREAAAGGAPAWVANPTTPTPAAAAPATVGINPPESKLAPAPPVNAVETPPPAETSTAPSTEVPKRGPGRPRKPTPAEPAKTEVSVEINVAGTDKVDEATSTIERLGAALTRGGEKIRVVWGKEKFQPLAYNDFEVGPFELEGFTKPGETIAQGYVRLDAELTTLAEASRAKKAASYAATLKTMGIVS